MTIKSQIIQTLNLIPENDLHTVLEVVRHFVPSQNDDIATPEDIVNHETAMREYLLGETVDHSEIDWS